MSSESQTGLVRIPRWYKLVLAIFILIPLIGFIVAVWMSIRAGGVSTTVVVSFIVWYLISILGINIGYHRLFTHKSFETSRAMRVFFAICGAMALEGSVFSWVADHRKHHQFSDRDGDPHSPHGHGEDFWSMVRGIWHAHVGWLFTQVTMTDQHKYAPDLLKDRDLSIVNTLFPLWVALSILLPGAITGIIGWSWHEALMGFLWCALARICIVHHITWSINSWCHVAGSRPFAHKSKDMSGNVAILGPISGGESYHHNHHAFPTSARHGLFWYQPDFSWWIIWSLSLFGLVWNVKVVDKEKIIQAQKGA